MTYLCIRNKHLEIEKKSEIETKNEIFRNKLYAQDMFTENYKIFLIEIKEDVNVSKLAR